MLLYWIPCRNGTYFFSLSIIKCNVRDSLWKTHRRPRAVIFIFLDQHFLWGQLLVSMRQLMKYHQLLLHTGSTEESILLKGHSHQSSVPISYSSHQNRERGLLTRWGSLNWTPSPLGTWAENIFSELQECWGSGSRTLSKFDCQMFSWKEIIHYWK